MAGLTVTDAGGLGLKSWDGTMPRDAAPAVPAPSASADASILAPDGASDTHPARKLRSDLQKELRRQVSVPDEDLRTKLTRVATNPYLVLSAATVGIGVAGVLTAGIPHLVLGAVGAGQLSANGSKAIDWWKSKRQGIVYLDSSAVDYLLSLKLLEAQVKAVEVALRAKPPGEVHITKEDLVKAQPKAGIRQRLSRVVGALRSPYGRAGLAILGAGLFLIAVSVIPEYIRDPSLRVAAVLSAIGGILIASAVVEAFKGEFDWLVGS